MFSARIAACAALLVAPASLFAQVPPVGVDRVNSLIENPTLPQDIEPFAKPVPERVPLKTPIADFKLSQTYLPRLGSNGFGTHDTDFSVQYALPRELCGKPLLLKAGFGAHAWDGPGQVKGSVDPALPGAVYDLYLDLGWKPRPFEWLFFDLGVTPGIYGDFQTLSGDAFRLRGRGLSILALSEEFQFVGGALYVNRNGPKVVPAGGFIWTPSDNTTFQIVFPQPKISHRLATFSDSSWWVYFAGEFGGGTGLTSGRTAPKHPWITTTTARSWDRNFAEPTAGTYAARSVTSSAEASIH